MNKFNRNMMNLSLAASAMFLSSALLAADLSLEPCVDGGVSATGLYASQQLEDEAERRYAEAFELEPCIDGGVSASGLYASQHEEDEATRALVDRHDGSDDGGV